MFPQVLHTRTATAITAGRVPAEGSWKGRRMSSVKMAAARADT